jgi:hypothetical protein
MNGDVRLRPRFLQCLSGNEEVGGNARKGTRKRASSRFDSFKSYSSNQGLMKMITVLITTLFQKPMTAWEP